jgi:hypothetical protein
MKKQKIIQILCFLIVLIVPVLATAQPGFGDDVDDVPVDGGLSILLAAGVGYGAKKLREKQQK